MTSNHCIHDIKATLYHITPIISDSTSTVSVSSHPDYWSYNLHCMYITAAICMTSHKLHMTSHPLFMISHHSMTSHPLYSFALFVGGEGNGKPLQYSCLENPIGSMKSKRYDTERWTPKVSSCSICYWRNNSRKNEEIVPKQKQRPVLDVTGGGSNVWCNKEQYCIGTWNVRSMNQGKLKVVIQEMARVDIDILGIGEVK